MTITGGSSVEHEEEAVVNEELKERAPNFETGFAS
jgi:hypothetical protein